MTTSTTVSFANFICKFGDHLNLLDLAEHVVIPAFLNPHQAVRRYKETRYFFLDTELINLSSNNDHPILAIAGRFIKDTIVHREQIYEPQVGLIKNSRSMESAPSSIFLLILNNHKLVYSAETHNAPGTGSFRSTVHWYLTRQWQDFISAEYERRKLSAKKDLTLGETQRITKAMIMKDFPRPSLDIIPLPSEMSLTEFIDRYETLKSISLKVLKTNSEIDNSNLLRLTRQTGSELNASSSTITHSGGDSTLDKNEAKIQLKAVALDGNTELRLSGKDKFGVTLTGNNDEFKARVPVDSLSPNIPVAAKQLYKIFTSQVTQNHIHLADSPDSKKVSSRIIEIAQRHNV